MGSTTETQLSADYRQMFAQSGVLAERGRGLFPNGVTHDSRSLNPFPVYVHRAAGARKWTVEDRELIDFWMGHGSLLLGHGHPAIVEAICRQASIGTHWAACHQLELEWAEAVCELVPSAERIRFTSSGTEATLMALRIARIATGRETIIKLAGHFHGWHDQLVIGSEGPHPELLQAELAEDLHDSHGNGGSDTAEQPHRLQYDTPGVTANCAQDIVVIPPNDVSALAMAIAIHQPAAVIIEATGGRWGVVPLAERYLQSARKLTADAGVLLILDEVISGFRVDPGGVQAIADVTPDLTTLAKVLAGGLPGGCVAGRADLLDTIAFGNRYGKKMKHPGTFNANPLSAAAGVAALDIVKSGEPCRIANRTGAQLRTELNRMFRRVNVDWVAYGLYSLTKILPTYNGPACEDGADETFRPYENDYRQVDRSIPRALTDAFRCALLLEGVDWMGWGAITSAAHTPDDIEQTVHAIERAIGRLRSDSLIE